MAKMPPPGTEGKPAMVVAIGTAKPNGKMPPPGSEEKQGSGKVSPDDAGVVREDQHCIDCQMYQVQSGTCDKVDGPFSPDDGCHEYFLALSGSDEPDADEQGGPSDNDADDQRSAQ